MTAEQRLTAGYTAPFVVYVGLMAFEKLAGVPLEIGYPIRCLAAVAAIWFFSRNIISWKVKSPLLSVALGAAVFLVWIGPDLLFGPGYRHFWLFENSLTGAASSGVASALQRQPLFLALRAAGSFLIVPILEELFWRGWLMRWLSNPDFSKVPIGHYAPMAFWVTAALFAAEHGSYWEVGFAAGILYNWWVVRTRSLADAILAHAVTNALLAAYVIFFGAWQYWL